jgi:CDP-6-deoxy-D-xylo-4-hexulose-3-dehydrase
VAQSGDERREVINAMDRYRIDTRVYTAGNLGRHPFWFENCGAFSAPVANRLNDGGFFLPNNQSLGTKDIEHVCEVVKGAVATYRKSKPGKRSR